ncbi:hypothetical protein [Chitinophaga vietnamensis]|uniref:hypothetical protein n=1 Tax=Chitinophaga vietnamensis TaxID=2593957 RepID=UPI001178CDD9|nr:hypothetical protein [Chitinophaga vietnamensis]
MITANASTPKSDTRKISLHEWFSFSQSVTSFGKLVKLFKATQHYKSLGAADQQYLSAFKSAIEIVISAHYILAELPLNPILATYCADDVNAFLHHLRCSVLSSKKFDQLDGIERDDLEFFLQGLEQWLTDAAPLFHCLETPAGVGEGGSGAAAAPSPGFIHFR